MIVHCLLGIVGVEQPELKMERFYNLIPGEACNFISAYGFSFFLASLVAF
jgi:hypothetical protein